MQKWLDLIKAPLATEQKRSYPPAQATGVIFQHKIKCPDHEHQVWNAVRCAHDTSQDQTNQQNMRCAKAGHKREGSVGKKHWKTDSGSKSTF